MKKENNSSVYNHINKTKLIPNLIQLTEYISIEDAKLKEKEYVEKYKNDDWVILNKAKTGSIGSNIVKWTKEECQKVALQCKTKTEFYNIYSSAYSSALKNGWIADVCNHMENKTKPKGYWTFEKCLEEAIKHRTRTKFRKYSKGALKSAEKNNWIDEIYKHLTKIKNENGYWTKEKCQEVALLYNNKKDLWSNFPTAMRTIIKNNWSNECFSHIIENKKPYGYWTFENCYEEALKYSTRGEFQKQSSSAYNVAKRHNWLDIICVHIKNKKKPPNYWTFEKCQEEALKYLTRGEFQKKSKSVYLISIKNDWLNEICSHMIKKHKYND